MIVHKLMLFLWQKLINKLPKLKAFYFISMDIIYLARYLGDTN